jgi:hypothetical protein
LKPCPARNVGGGQRMWGSWLTPIEGGEAFGVSDGDAEMLRNSAGMASWAFGVELLASIFINLNGVSEAAWVVRWSKWRRCWRDVEVEETEWTGNRTERGVVRRHIYGKIQGSDSECLEESISSKEWSCGQSERVRCEKCTRRAATLLIWEQSY